MPQHDYLIADASGASFLADLNNALAAIVSNNSGAAAPSTTYAYQLWADTGSTPPTLRQRNAANNAWIALGELGVGSLGGLSPASSGTRNVLINANPIINQRGYVSGTATTAANQYTLDRWRVVTLGQSVPWSDSNNVRTVTAPASGIEQVIEGSGLVSGTYTLNWTGTAAATVAGVAVTKGSQVTLTGGANTAVRFSGGTFSLPQLERGSAATQFELRSEGDELSACQRYYYRPNSTFFYQQYASSGQQNIAAPFFFPVTMRAVPTLSGDSGWGNGLNATAGTTQLFTHGLYASLSSAGAGIFHATFSLGSVSAEL
jgi:hypothetical protein